MSDDAAVAIDRIAEGLLGDPSDGVDFGRLWSQVAASRPDPKASGRLLALAGAFLWRPPCVSSAQKHAARLTDVHAIRAHALLGQSGTSTASSSSQAELAIAPEAMVHESRRAEAAQEAMLAQLCGTVWWISPRQAEADEVRRAVRECVNTWLSQTCDGTGDVATALMDLLPAVVTAMRSENCLGQRQRCDDSRWSFRQNLIVILGVHWIVDNAHYRAMKGRLGLCLPVVLQTLDSCTNPVVRMLGLDALHLTLDRAMGAEVENFVPPLEHCFGTTSPLFLDGDGLAIDSVAPYCAGHVLFLLKGYPQLAASRRQEMFDKLLSFGTMHCSVRPRAFRLFLEFGLRPLIQRDVLLVAPRLSHVLEILLRATEAVDPVEVFLAWDSLSLLFGSKVKPRMQRYRLDLLLRLAFSYLTYVASDPPPCVGDHDTGRFVSPVVAAMTKAEWQLVEEQRPAIRLALERVASLLSAHGDGQSFLETALSELQAALPLVPARNEQFKSSQEEDGIEQRVALVQQLHNFSSFVRAATSAPRTSDMMAAVAA